MARLLREIRLKSCLSSAEGGGRRGGPFFVGNEKLVKQTDASERKEEKKTRSQNDLASRRFDGRCRPGSRRHRRASLTRRETPSGRGGVAASGCPAGGRRSSERRHPRMPLSHSSLLRRSSSLIVPTGASVVQIWE